MNRLHTRLVSPCEKELLASCIQETTPVFLRSREIIERSPFFAVQTVRSARIKARLAPWHVPMSFVFPWPIFLLRSPAESVQWAASRLLRTPARYGLSCAFVHCAAAAMSEGPFSFRRVRSLSWGALFTLYVRVRSQSLAVRSTRTQAWGRRPSKVYLAQYLTGRCAANLRLLTGAVRLCRRAVRARVGGVDGCVCDWRRGGLCARFDARWPRLPSAGRSWPLLQLMSLAL